MPAIPAIRLNAACRLTLGGAALSLVAMWIVLQVDQGTLPTHFFFAGLALLHLAFMMDGLDGYVARRYSLQSELGKQLDSLADVINHLVGPALFLWALGLRDGWSSLALGALVLGGITRLATFNIIGNPRSPRGRLQYVGVPTFYSHFLLDFLCVLRSFMDGSSFAALAAVLVTGLALSYNIRIPTPKPARLRTVLVLSGAMILGALVAFLLRTWSP